MEDGEQFTNDEIDGYYIENDEEEEEEELQENSIYPDGDDDSIELEVATTVASGPVSKLTSNNTNRGIIYDRGSQVPFTLPHEFQNGGWISEDEKNESF